MTSHARILLSVLLAGMATIARADDNPAIEQARKKFEAADAELNKVYRQTIGSLDKAKAAQLRDAERDWIAYREDMISADFPDEAGKPDHSADYWQTMTIYSRDRAVFVRAWTGKNLPPGITGKYSDSYDGTLELTETKDGVDFSLYVLRTRAHNEGEMDGTIHIKNGKAYFKEELQADEQGPPCELEFTFIDNHIVHIEEKVASSSVGANVHFDGDYYRIDNKIGNPDKTAGPETEPAATPAPPASAMPAPAAAATPAQPKPTLDQARKAFDAADNVLTTAYKEAGAGLDAGKMAELRQSERDWIQYREMMAESAPFFNTGAQSDSPKHTADYWQTMTDLTRDRIDFLRGWSGKKVPPGITGVYSDSAGGTLELGETKAGLAFSINTVRGMARSEGSIEGVAQHSGDKAVFKDHPDEGDDRPPCEITFTFIEGHIVKVEEKNGDYYHGFNANFDGLYYKIGRLEKPLKTE